ncbi:hypothetical protein BST99_05330 [Aureicoccus marinus]|uniref:Uncharacterized protein n=1 Tax=Aureicoccus marinus TaxID=754435 RepID=A0A2S7T6Z5_9FLAO|nr:hypothetical protein BST99_05330 [Aureicoccus marinus]
MLKKHPVEDLVFILAKGECMDKKSKHMDSVYCNSFGYTCMTYKTTSGIFIKFNENKLGKTLRLRLYPYPNVKKNSRVIFSLKWPN